MDVSTFHSTAMMMMMAFGLFLSIQGAVATDQAETERLLQAGVDCLVDAYNAGDVAAMLDCHVDDLQIMPPGMGLVDSKEALAVQVNGSTEKYPYFTMKITEMEALCEDYVITELNYTRSASEDAAPSQFGETVILWKKEGGVMKIKWGIWSPDNRG